MWGQAIRLSTSSKRNLQKSLQAFILQSSHKYSKPALNKINKFLTWNQSIVRKEEVSADRTFLQVYPPPSDMTSQSVVLPGPEGIRASAIVDDPTKLAEFPDDKTFTVCDILNNTISKSRNEECLGTRSPKTGKYEWMIYAEVDERKDYVGSGLINLGFPASEATKIGICTKNRAEFVLTMLGCCQYEMVLVPLYNSFGIDALSYIIAEVELGVVICESLDTAKDIIKNSEKYPQLKHLVLIEGNEEDVLKLKNPKIEVMSFKKLEEIGKANLKEPMKPKPNSLFCICYTSGTTGYPKGVMISHGNILSSIAALELVFKDAVPTHKALVSYLPCAHIYEIINEIYSIYHGGRIGFYSGNVNDLLDDIQELKPTVMPLVPKLMNAIHSRVKSKVMPNPITRSLYRLGLREKERDLRNGIVSKVTLWDRVMFADIHKLLGGSAQLIFTASAPVSKDVMQFFRCASGGLVFEAYGQSEVCAATMTLMSEHGGGFVGPPLPSNHIKLVSVPELSYDAADDVGEVCIRGPNVFLGYYKNPEATREAIDENGWHHTGDIGRWLPNGGLALIDRKKHLFKMSQGEYVAPEKSENAYAQSHIVSQVYFDGLPEQDFAVAIIVPDAEPFMKWAKQNGFKNSNFEQLCEDKDVRIAVLKHLLEVGKRKKLNSLHQAGNVYVSTEAFTVENGLITPTMKLKRPTARKQFKNIIDQLYEEGNMRKDLELNKL